MNIISPIVTVSVIQYHPSSTSQGSASNKAIWVISLKEAGDAFGNGEAIIILLTFSHLFLRLSKSAEFDLMA